MWATGRRGAVQYMQITLQHELQFRVTVTTVTSDTVQVVSFVLCPLNILPVSADDVCGWQGRT